jgi:predicted CoA-binding protein
MSKKTLILGATPNPDRYAYKAAYMLTRYGHPIVNVGIKKGEVAGEPILNGQPIMDGIDTVTLYIGPEKQKEYEQYIMLLQPKRVIFNPGTENPLFEDKLRTQGIEPLEACTLVLLSTGNY